MSYIKNVLNPKETLTINRKEIEDKNYDIIPLNQVLDKANEIENKIKDNNIHFHYESRRSDNTLNKFSSILEKEKEKEISNDFESFSTKENENSIKHSSSSKSSLFSSYTENSNSLESPNLIKTQKNINNLKNSLCNVEFGLNKKIDSDTKKLTFYSSKTVNIFNDKKNLGKLRENLNLNSKYNITKFNPRGSLNLNNNTFNYNNIKNSYNNNNYPIQNGQYMYYLNNNNVNYNLGNNRVQYANFAVYYS